MLAAMPAAAQQDAASRGAASELAVAVRARAIGPGDVVPLTVACRCTPSAGVGRARVFDRDIPLVPLPDGSGWSGLAGVDVETARGVYRGSIQVDAADGRQLAATFTLTVIDRTFPTRRLRVAPVYVEPPAAERQRIAADATRLNAIYATTTRSGPAPRFEAPVAAAPQNTFGARSIFNGQPRSLHAGVDFSAPAGTPIAAPADGSVVLADDLFFTGRTVVIDHGNGLYSILAHLSTMLVAAGERAAAGHIVGKVGATGRATGPHLHWSVRLNGARVNPLSLIGLTPLSPDQHRARPQP
jgi:murein DD-endopeptidase MepM/ murein hydrolase activator NlpD